MARFITSASGRAKTIATRLGGSPAGVESHARGWDLGAFVSMHVVNEVRTPSGKVKDPGLDLCTVYLTSGSNGGSVLLDLGQWTRTGDGELKAASPRAELILAALSPHKVKSLDAIGIMLQQYIDGSKKED